jgi:hypothetical protein
VLPLPEGQRASRRAEAAGPVDGGAAAHAAALQDVDGLVGGLARGGLLVELRVGLALALLEVAAAAQRAFLDDQHRQAGLRQQFGRDAAAGAAADDGHVDRGLRGQRRALGAEHLPLGQALAHRVGQLAHSARGPG